MAKGPSQQQKPKLVFDAYYGDFASQQAEVGRLIAGIPNDPDQWDSALRDSLTGMYSAKLFSTQNVNFFGKKGDRIDKAVRKTKLLNGAVLPRSIIYNVQNGEPVTMQYMCLVAEACRRMGGNNDLMNLVMVAGQPRGLDDNSVVASIFRVMRTQIKGFREGLQLTRDQFGYVLYGDNSPVSWSISTALESPAFEEGGRLTDLWVSWFTADRVYSSMSMLHHHFPSKQSVDLRPRGYYFGMGRNNGERLFKALGFKDWNDPQFLRYRDRQDILARVIKLAIDRGEAEVNPPYVIPTYTPSRCCCASQSDIGGRRSPGNGRIVRYLIQSSCG